MRVNFTEEHAAQVRAALARRQEDLRELIDQHADNPDMAPVVEDLEEQLRICQEADERVVKAYGR